MNGTPLLKRLILINPKTLPGCRENLVCAPRTYGNQDFTKSDTSSTKSREESSCFYDTYGLIYPHGRSSLPISSRFHSHSSSTGRSQRSSGCTGARPSSSVSSRFFGSPTSPTSPIMGLNGSSRSFTLAQN